MEGGAELNRMLGRSDDPIPVESLCVRIGAMRCHSQAVTLKLNRDLPLDRIEQLIGVATNGCASCPTPGKRRRRAFPGKGQRPARHRGRAPAQGSDRWPVPLAFTVGDQLLWAPLSRSAACCAYCSRVPGPCGIASRVCLIREIRL